MFILDHTMGLQQVCVTSSSVALVVNSQDGHMFSNLVNMWHFFF